MTYPKYIPMDIDVFVVLDIYGLVNIYTDEYSICLHNNVLELWPPATCFDEWQETLRSLSEI